jgi:hypothetical protein
MSIFGSIMAKVFGTAPAALQPAPASAPAADATAPAAAPADASDTAAPAAAAPTPLVDVAGTLDGMAANAGETLDWRKSIVDLMKVLGLDSSLASRKQLAEELHYDGNMEDSASMNVWLHQQVMTKFAENGGNIPAELRG